MTGLAWGGDYNPEQWPEEVWHSDVELMRRAGVNLVTVGVFSWALLEPEQGRFEFGWLDRVLALLHDAGVRVDLATATAAPPPWLTQRYPEVLPVRADGVRLWPGSRQSYCPTAPAYRERSVELAQRMAQRYGEHPALACWHVGDEYGVHVARCYCDRCGEAFRAWLRARYDDLDALNEAWGTAFWSQHYSAWEQILPPRVTPTYGNPGQLLDFDRFCSDALLDLYRAELAVLRRITPTVPVTTNFMVMHTFAELDYWAWAREVDFVSNDHYPQAGDPNSHIELAFSADTCRGLAAGSPWLLMEHAPSAVNWQPRNLAPGAGRRRHAVLPVACVQGRRRALPLGDGAARRSRHQGVPCDVPNGRGVPGDRGDHGLHGAGFGGPGVRLAGRMGRRTARDTHRRLLLPAQRTRRLPSTVASWDHGGRRSAVGRAGPVPAGRRALAAHGQRCRRAAAAPLCRRRRACADHLVLGDRRRARAGAAWRLPGRVP
jgi:hypothetical protein